MLTEHRARNQQGHKLTVHQPWAGDDGEERLDEVKPGARRWDEMQADPWVFGQPGVDVGVLVGVVVIAYHPSAGAAGRSGRRS